MKIWFLTGEFAPDFGGGIGTYVENCAKMFAQAGDDVTVIVRSLNGNKEEKTKEGYRVVRFQQGEGEYYTYLGYDNALAYQYYDVIMKLIDKYGKPDIIEMQEYNAYGQYIIQNKLMLNEKLKDIPLVVHLHTPSFETLKINQFNTYEAPFYWIGEMEKFCIKGADALVCPSQFLADKLQYLVDDKIKVINLPFDIDKEELEKYEQSNPYQSDKKTLLYFGRTEYRKGVVQMLKGAEKLWKKGLDFKVKIIGGDTKLESKGTFIGEELKKKYAKYIESGNLEMLDPIPHLDLIPHILSATAVTIPSLYENFPNTCIYSMWLGKPVLVSKSGGQAEMVQESGKNGLIFDWDKEGDFEEKLEQLLNMSDDELKTMGDNAKERINSLCNMENNLKLRREFFEDVIKNKNKIKDKFPFVEEMPKDAYNKEYKGEKDLLSIVIPYYNLGKTLPETIESVKKSEYKNYEIIIVNDGSTDQESIDVLKNYEDDEQIRILNIENKGLANARNVGAEAAKGEFVAFIDADDKIDKTFYRRAIDILHQYNNVSYVYSWVQYFEGSEAVWPTFNVHIPYLLCANMLAAYSVIRKNDFLNFGKNRIMMEYGMEDYDGWVSLAEHGCLGVSIPEKLNLYRVRKDSMSRQFNKKMRIYLYQTSRQGHEKIFEKYSKDIYMLLLTNGQPFYWNNPTTPVFLPTAENTVVQVDERIYKLERILNTFPGRVARKVYRGLRKVKHAIKK
jgi:glycosyltransferase involved in cell wall biosynthesis